MSGFIHLHRKVLDNPVCCKDAEHLAVWVWLLLKAAWIESDVMFEGKRITLHPGDLPPISRRTIARELQMNESKVQRILKTFENEHQIEQQMGSKCRLISIVSWSEYQSAEPQTEPQVNHSRTTDEPQTDTIKETKNTNKNSLSNKCSFGSFKNVLLTDKEYQRLREKYPDDIERAIAILDCYIEETGRAYKSHAAALQKWAIEAARKEKESRGRDIDARTGDKKCSRMAGAAGRNDGAAQNFADINIPMAQDIFSS